MPTKGLLVTILLLILNQKIFGQLSPSSDAYLLFDDTSSSLKLGYFNRPQMAEKLSDLQNKTYASLGIKTLIVLKVKDGVKDTVAIRRFDKNGFVMEIDTFSWNERHVRYQGIFRYEYLIDQNIVKAKYQLTSMENDTFYFSKFDELRYYDHNNCLFKSVRYNKGDTTTSNIYIDQNRIIKGYKIYGSHEGLIRENSYEFEFDNRGRLTYYSDGSFTLVYDDKKHSVQVGTSEECKEIYILNKKRHVYQDYCCPLSERRLKNGNSSMRKTTLTFDKKLRIRTEGYSYAYDNKNLCEGDGQVY